MIAMKIPHLKNLRGFTLIEVLIAMIIFAIGMLGLAGLQTRALQDNQDAYLRTQAIFLANDMGDRIKANTDFWGLQTTTPLTAARLTTAKNNAEGYSANGYPHCSTDDAPTGGTGEPANFCLSNIMAYYDWYHWRQNAIDTLPSGDTDITWIAPASRDDDGAYLTITVSWVQSVTAMAGAASTMPDPSVTLLVRAD